MLQEHLCIVYNNNNNTNSGKKNNNDNDDDDDNNNNNNNNNVRENPSRRKPQITHKFCIPHEKHHKEA